MSQNHSGVDPIESKYFAYYISQCKPQLMNDIRAYVSRTFGDNDAAKNIYSQIEANIFVNEWEGLNSENLELNLRSLVLVKITNVNGMFINRSGEVIPVSVQTYQDDPQSKWLKVNTSNIGFRYKYCNGDTSNYKIRNTTFTGTQSTTYTINTGSSSNPGNTGNATNDHNYIFIEKLFIPMRDIFNFYDYIEFDNQECSGSPFQQFIHKVRDYGVIDSFGIKLLTVLNAILKVIPDSDSTTWRIIKGFLPLLDESLFTTVEELWYQIMKNELELAKPTQPYLNNPFKFLSNHRSIVVTEFHRCKYEQENENYRYQDEHDANPNFRSALYTFKCQINAKLYITTKKWHEITYLDAMPYKSFFMCNENIYTSNDEKHNLLANRIETHEHNLTSLKKQLTNRDLNESKKNELQNKITVATREISNLLKKLTPVNTAYQNHILHRTDIGVRTNFNDYVNSHKVIVFMRSILSKAALLKDCFQFKYEITGNRSEDTFKLYISKETLSNILSLNIKIDLFSLSRLFKLTMENRFDDHNIEVVNYNYNRDIGMLQPASSSDSIVESMKCLDIFLKDNLAVELIRHQKSNLLWMVKLEDEIDKSNVVINSLKCKFDLMSDHIDGIKSYILGIKNKIPESFIKNCCIDFRGKQLLIELKEDTPMARSISILNQLNSENIRHYGSNLSNHYNYDSNIIDKITSFDEYRAANTVPVQLCGGAICDEVGLGKTLSVISSIIMKKRDDMVKYGKYKKALGEVVCKLDENIYQDYVDPLETGFEHNNLIIVPSRLTSQWESEIQKYCKDKFKLHVKVLAGIQAVKNLEKELGEFYELLGRGEITSADEFRNRQNGGGKKKSKNTATDASITGANTKAKPTKETQKDPKYSKTTNSEYTYDISQEPIIRLDNFNEPEIVFTESGILPTPNKTTKTMKTKREPTPAALARAKAKEQKLIEKLMKQAQKAASKGNGKVKTKDDAINEGNTCAGITGTGNVDNRIATLDNILNISNLETPDEKENKHNTTSTITSNEIKNENSIHDPYSYILPHLRSSDSVDDDYNKEQLYDVYIVSINLLSNENYLSYVHHNYFNHLHPFPDVNINKTIRGYMADRIIDSVNGIYRICRVTNNFNIFRIKWNRVIIDEAHEKLAPIVKFFSTSLKNFTNNTNKINADDQFLFENLVSLKANYKWAMTGTPSQNGIDNIMGILQFLAKTPYLESFDAKVQKVRYFTNLLGVSGGEVNKCLGTIFKKTLKKDVKALLNIPIFSEEVIYVDQTNIERNIYNTIRASRHFTEAVKIKRLFLMCTNILINEGYDFDSNSDIPATAEIITLEQLNANMIARFTEQLNNLAATETRLQQTNDLLITRKSQWQAIVDYIQVLGLDKKIEKTILAEVRNCFDFQNKNGHSIRSNVELVYKLLDIFTAYNEPESAGMVIYMNYQSMKEALERYWKTTWENEDTMTWIAQQGAILGGIKCQDDIHRNNSKIAGMQADKKRINNQIALFSNNEFLKEKTADPCIICFEDLRDVVVTPCRHVFCLGCTKQLSQDLKHNFSCPECRTPIKCDSLNITTVDIINGQQKPVAVVNNSTLENGEKKPITGLEKTFGIEWRASCTNKYGSKMTRLVEYLYSLFDASSQNRVIIFSQYDKMLRMIGKTLDEYRVKYVYCHGNNFVLNKNINRFKKDESIRVIMLSSETSNSGSNLTEANYIIFIDVLYQDLEHVKATEAQAIGRAVRLGQKLPVKVVRFITRGTIEEEHYRKNQYDMNILQQ